MAEEGFLKRIGRSFKEGFSGAIPSNPSVAPVNVFSNGSLVQDDLRVKIRVPGNYSAALPSSKITSILQNTIIFPYTPQIGFEYKANYTSLNVTHSNYSQYFYNNSSVSAFNIAGKFTVQNDRDANIYLATKHLLSALTKMPYADDPGAGSPPPICRLDAYGPYMLKNIPIVISSFRIDLPADVDYFNANKNSMVGLTDQEINQSRSGGQNIGDFINTPSYAEAQKNNAFGQNFVPVSSNFTVGCIPIYSRREMLQFGVKKYLEDYDNNTKYL
jgi:hypothetical protein